MTEYGPEDDIEISMTIPPGRAIERMHESVYVAEMAFKLSAWIGEFGDLDVATAYAIACAHVMGKRKRAVPPSPADGSETER